MESERNERLPKLSAKGDRPIIRPEDIVVDATLHTKLLKRVFPARIDKRLSKKKHVPFVLKSPRVKASPHPP